MANHPNRNKAMRPIVKNWRAYRSGATMTVKGLIEGVPMILANIHEIHVVGGEIVAHGAEAGEYTLSIS